MQSIVGNQAENSEYLFDTKIDVFKNMPGKEVISFLKVF